MRIIKYAFQIQAILIALSGFSFCKLNTETSALLEMNLMRYMLELSSGAINPEILSVAPEDYSNMAEDQIITVVFDRQLIGTTAEITGLKSSSGYDITLVATNVKDDTFVIKPKSTWINGDITPVITFTDVSEQQVDLILTYQVFKDTAGYNADAVYAVAPNTSGKDSNTGKNFNDYKATIQSAIDEANKDIAAGDVTSAVVVVEGDIEFFHDPYIVSSPVTLSPDIHLLGGYDFIDYDRPNDYISKIESSCTAGTCHTVKALDSKITNSNTTLQKFVIQGGSGTDSRAVYISGASPTIERNTINGGAGTSSHGIYVSGGAPLIKNNMVDGEGGTTSYGIFTTGVKGSLIYNNTVDGGTAGTTKTALETGAKDDIINNIFKNSTSSCITSSANPISVKNNNFSTCPSYFGTYDTICGGDIGIGGCTTVLSSTLPSSGSTDAAPILSSVWKLTASSPAAVTQGGKNLSGTVDEDFFGTARTVPCSIGAHERD